jgi:hypothetical protein
MMRNRFMIHLVFIACIYVSCGGSKNSNEQSTVPQSKRSGQIVDSYSNKTSTTGDSEKGCIFNSNDWESSAFELPVVCRNYDSLSDTDGLYGPFCNKDSYVEAARDFNAFKAEFNRGSDFTELEYSRRLRQAVANLELAGLIALSKEPFLTENISEQTEAFRLIRPRSAFIRSALSFIVVRVEKTGDSYRVVTKKQPAEGIRPKGPQYYCSVETRSITFEEWQTLKQKADAAAFQQLPWQEEKERLVKDGTVWYLEGVLRNEYNRTYRVSPTTGNDIAAYADLVQYISLLGGITRADFF